MQFELNEETFARFKAFGMTEVDIAFLLRTNTYGIQNFKLSLDQLELNERVQQLQEESRIVQKYLRKTKKIK